VQTESKTGEIFWSFLACDGKPENLRSVLLEVRRGAPPLSRAASAATKCRRRLPRIGKGRVCGHEMQAASAAHDSIRRVCGGLMCVMGLKPQGGDGFGSVRLPHNRNKKPLLRA
jgi:hypothetical protein